VTGGWVGVYRGDELDHLVDEVASQLRKQAITGSRQKDRIMLGVDVGRLGYVNRGNLRDMCVNHQLPCDDDIVDSVCCATPLTYHHNSLHCILCVRNMNSNQQKRMQRKLKKVRTYDY